MNRRGTGIVLVGIAAYLLSIRYILAFIDEAQWGINWPLSLLFFMTHMKSLFGVRSWIALVAGIAYIVTAEIHKEK